MQYNLKLHFNNHFTVQERDATMPGAVQMPGA